MVLPIYLYGQPVLRREAEDVPQDFPELKTLIANMFETLLQAEGCGLAAPQVGQGIRLFIKCIPYNFYAIFTLVMIVAIIVMRFDYATMAKFEMNAVENGDLRKALIVFFAYLLMVGGLLSIALVTRRKPFLKSFAKP